MLYYYNYYYNYYYYYACYFYIFIIISIMLLLPSNRSGHQMDKEHGARAQTQNRRSSTAGLPQNLGKCDSIWYSCSNAERRRGTGPFTRPYPQQSLHQTGWQTAAKDWRQGS